MRSGDRALRGSFDVLVIGGGVAGLAGALTLVRARRSVLVVDSGQPRNATADHAHGYLTRDGARPVEMLEIGRSEVRGYGGTITDDTVISLRRVEGGFLATLAGGTCVRATSVLLATGMADVLPEIPGLRARWGRDVVSCPHCHGWELRDQPLGVLATNPLAAAQALMWRQWSADIVLLAHDLPAPDGDLAECLAARGIRVIDGEVVGLEVSDDRLGGVWLRSGRLIPLSALIVAPRFEPRNALLQALQDVRAEGVWVAGNAADPSAGLAQAAASGFAAGSAIDASMNREETARTLLTWRSQTSPSQKDS